MQRREFLYRSFILVLTEGLFSSLTSCGGGNTPSTVSSTVEFQTISYENSDALLNLMNQASQTQQAPADLQTIFNGIDAILTPAQKSMALNLYPAGLSEAEFRTRAENYSNSLFKNENGTIVLTPPVEFAGDELNRIQTAMMALPLQAGLLTLGDPQIIDSNTGQVINQVKEAISALETTCLDKACYSNLTNIAYIRFLAAIAACTSVAALAFINALKLLAIPIWGEGLFAAACALIVTIQAAGCVLAATNYAMDVFNAKNTCQKKCHQQGGIAP